MQPRTLLRLTLGFAIALGGRRPAVAKSAEPPATAAPTAPPTEPETPPAHNSVRPLMGLAPRAGTTGDTLKAPHDPSERRAWLQQQIDGAFKAPAGKIRTQQGFFMVERGCPNCRGSGEVITNPCANCHGEGRAVSQRRLSVKIPGGVDDGTRIRVASEGEAGVRGAGSGDLYLFVHMKRHPIYAREGSTLIAECPVSFTTAALGGSISLPGIDGHQVDLKIPAGIQSGEQLRHRGSGMSVLNGRGRGDLMARILVETPTHMSKEQKKLLEEFRATETGDECPAAKSFFARARDYFAS